MTKARRGHFTNVHSDFQPVTHRQSPLLLRLSPEFHACSHDTISHLLMNSPSRSGRLCWWKTTVRTPAAHGGFKCLWLFVWWDPSGVTILHILFYGVTEACISGLPSVPAGLSEWSQISGQKWKTVWIPSSHPVTLLGGVRYHQRLLTTFSVQGKQGERWWTDFKWFWLRIVNKKVRSSIGPVRFVSSQGNLLPKTERNIPHKCGFVCE